MVSKVNLSDFDVAKEYWIEFYKKYEIDSSSLKNIELTDKGREKKKWAARECGFDKIVMIPIGISQQSLLEKKEFSVFEGSKIINQNTGKNRRIKDNCDFLIGSKMWQERTGCSQVLFLKNKSRVDDETDETMKKIKNYRPDLLINVGNNYSEGTREHGYKRIKQMEKELDLRGLSFVEVMILDRQYFDEGGFHMFNWDKKNATWLTRTKERGAYANFGWDEVDRLWFVNFNFSSYYTHDLGTIFSCCLEIRE
jgi:hypothetical protein